MNPELHEVILDQLREYRRAVFTRLGISEEELNRRLMLEVESPEEWDAWREIGEIDFLLGGTGGGS